MSFRVSAWAIRNPIPVVSLFLALTLAGLVAYLQLPIKQFPNIDFPIVTVTVTQSGAAPSEVENQITRSIENALTGPDQNSLVTGKSVSVSVDTGGGRIINKQQDNYHTRTNHLNK